MNPDFILPDGFGLLMPYENAEVRTITKKFFTRFYNDTDKRIFILGINPGRFGAGTTGIAFTDPVQLKIECGIANKLETKQELSSTFIYRMINHAGGVFPFYSRFFLTAVCPVGFVKDGKNINYYDDRSLLKNSSDFIAESLTSQIRFGAYREMAICLGEGKNFKYLSELNQKHKMFDEIIPLAHPRFIMQYRRKDVREYVRKYIKALEKAVKKTGC